MSETPDKDQLILSLRHNLQATDDRLTVVSVNFFEVRKQRDNLVARVKELEALLDSGEYVLESDYKLNMATGQRMRIGNWAISLPIDKTHWRDALPGATPEKCGDA